MRSSAVSPELLGLLLAWSEALHLRPVARLALWWASR